MLLISSFYVKTYFKFSILYSTNLTVCTEIENVANSRDSASVAKCFQKIGCYAAFKKAQCQLTTYLFRKLGEQKMNLNR